MRLLTPRGPSSIFKQTTRSLTSPFRQHATLPWGVHPLRRGRTSDSAARIHTGASSRQHSYSRPTHHAIDPVAILVAIAITSATGYLTTEYLYPLEPSSQKAPPSQSPSPAPITPAEEDEYTMAATDLAGRPGHLTAEQEVRLKEFWQSAFEIFGVLEPAHGANGVSRASSAASSPNPNLAPSPLLSAESPNLSKRKSRLSWFGRHGKDAETDGDAVNGAEDKHGQNKEFKKAVASQSSESFRLAFWGMVKHDDPDAMMLRFLRARKWDVHDALVMMIATLHWRMVEMRVDEEVMSLGETGFAERSKSGTAETKKDAEDFLAQVKMGKSLIHGCDREGRPVCTVRVRKHIPGQQTERALEMYTVYVIETTRLLLKAPVDTATVIFDMTSFSMSNMDYTPVKFMIKCFEANYPESLGSVLVYKSPWIFQGIWKIIRGWLDPVVAAKVHFCDDEAQLSAYVDRKRIPKEMGGDEDWEYEYIEPRQGEDERMKDAGKKNELEKERKGVWEEYERQTVSWIKDGQQGAKEERSRLAKGLRENYWRLDPYVRARSLYDRIGMINEGGAIDFYPQDKAKTVKDTSAEDVD
ncbi:CRAL-TRIO domain-containing protein [Sphaceloma murrayae]|uniref:CRAL-TRIO domain-containing protein n=1 Tax=Sphaceloma murrayae TaxID=2082308 RepID=A0A2K1R245_9PEZI|nr:CRAL-TRIO domain-containing protein [Sphaceloma murrayae]